MVHHIVLFKTNPTVTSELLDDLVLQTRIQLLKIPEVLSIRCGKRIDQNNEWAFFLAIDFESTEKLNIYLDDSRHVKYVEDIVKPHTSSKMVLDYEMEPGKDVKYS